jgi:hypothetical protein
VARRPFWKGEKSVDGVIVPPWRLGGRRWRNSWKLYGVYLEEAAAAGEGVVQLSSGNNHCRVLTWAGVRG